MNTKLKIKIDFDVAIGDLPEINIKKLARHMERDGYSDGRKHFDVEMIEHALSRHIERNIVSCLNEKYREIYGNEMVQTSPSGSTSKAVLEAEKEMKNVRYVYVNLGFVDADEIKENENE